METHSSNTTEKNVFFCWIGSTTSPSKKWMCWRTMWTRIYPSIPFFIDAAQKGTCYNSILCSSIDFFFISSLVVFKLNFRCYRSDLNEKKKSEEKNLNNKTIQTNAKVAKKEKREKRNDHTVAPTLNGWLSFSITIHGFEVNKSLCQAHNIIWS